jgi:peptidyl-dipeptidase Dcp
VWCDEGFGLLRNVDHITGAVRFVCVQFAYSICSSTSHQKKHSSKELNHIDWMQVVRTLRSRLLIRSVPPSVKMAAFASSSVENNPLLSEFKTPYGLPPFNLISHHHYEPAIVAAIPLHMADLNAIVANCEEPTFENTIAAFDRAGEVLANVLRIFSNLCSSQCPPDLQKVQMKMSGPLAEHDNNVITVPGLFQRIDTVYTNRLSASPPLTPEQIRLTERIHLNFVRAGAMFTPAAQQRYKEIMMELAELMTEFSQNVLSDESNFTLPIEDLAGLPADLVAAAEQAATERGLPAGSHLITLSRSLVEPFLTYSDNRELRETAWRAWISR